jgi:lysozyme
MKASQLLINKIKELEGVKLSAYKCPAGIPTIGVGHTKGVKMGQMITMQQADSLLKGDLLPVETFLNGLKIPFTQGQFDALCDFAFNLGIGALDKSTLLRKARININDKTIPDEFVKWVHAGGKVLQGLVKRRNWEAMKWQESI